MELKRYSDAEPFPFGNLSIRDVTPELLGVASMAEIEVPIAADNPPFAAAGKKKVYVGISGDVEFDIGGERVRVRSGDVLLVEAGEKYSYHNGGYEPARLLLLQIPGVASQEARGTT